MNDKQPIVALSWDGILICLFSAFVAFKHDQRVVNVQKLLVQVQVSSWQSKAVPRKIQ